MPTLGGILNTARLAIGAHQTAIQVTSHNVANAETPGYTRQRATLEQNTPFRTAGGVVGTGVRVTDVTQVRDTLLDASFRRDTTQASGFGLRRDLLGQLEGVFAEPTEAGLAATLDAFWNSWADLANAPATATGREVVAQRGAQVAHGLNGYARRLDELTADTGLRLERSAVELSELSRQVAELNVQIVAMEAGGHTAGDLRDARNVAVDRLATLADVRVHERPNGSVAVLLAGQSLVDGSDHKTVRPTGSPPAVRLAFAGSSQPLPELGGELGAMLGVMNRDVPQARARLDELAGGIVGAVNAAHAGGWSPAQEPMPASPPYPAAPPGWAGSGVAFFDPAGVTAATIGLSAAVAGDRDMIAAGRVYGGSGDNAVARELSQLRDTPASVGTPGRAIVLGTHYRDTVAAVAVDAGAAGSSATVFETLAAQAEVRRQSAAGVSTDEELIALMRHQQAYVAATRLVSAVDEMAQALLGMV